MQAFGIVGGISREIRRWRLHHRSDKSLQDLAEMYNPIIRGWIGYYSTFYRTQLRPTQYILKNQIFLPTISEW
jgi:hypothetical protein